MLNDLQIAEVQLHSRSAVAVQLARHPVCDDPNRVSVVVVLGVTTEIVSHILTGT
jgi:hypothetical protein